MTVVNITPNVLFNLLQDVSTSKLVLDTRSREDFDAGHLPCALCLEDLLDGLVTVDVESIDPKPLFLTIGTKYPTFRQRSFVFRYIIVYGDTEKAPKLAFLLAKEAQECLHGVPKMVYLLLDYDSFAKQYPFMPIATPHPTAPKIPNMLYPTEIIPGKLYLGTYENATSEAQLRHLGITHIVNAADELEDRFAATGFLRKWNAPSRPFSMLL